MNRRQTLVIGASGFVGGYLLTVFGEDRPVTGTYARYKLPGLVPLDFTDEGKVRTIFRELRPEVVLCPAAQPHVEGCEQRPEATRKVNVAPLLLISELARSIGAKLVFLSTEYVFDGTAGPYSEDDTTNPINEYGRQKLAAERMIRDSTKDYLIVRLSAPYGWELRGKSFVVNLLRQLRAGQVVPVPQDQVITPTYVLDFARAVRSLVDSGYAGTYHVAGPRPMIRSEFARLAAAVFALDTDLVQPVSTTQLNLLARRPANAGLKTDRIQALLGAGLTEPREGLEAMRATEAGNA